MKCFILALNLLIEFKYFLWIISNLKKITLQLYIVNFVFIIFISEPKVQVGSAIATEISR